MNRHKIEISDAQCIGCGLCENICPTRNIELKDKKANVLSDDCSFCGHCASVCPKEAIKISGYDAEVLSKKQDVRLNPSEVLDVIRFRRTIRQFQEKDIPTDVIRQILEAGSLTHTAKNMQDVSFVVLDKQKERIERLAVRFFKKIKPFANLFSKTARRVKITENFFFYRAPIVIVVTAKDVTNGILAAQNMEFVAEANGLGTLFSGFFTTAANISGKIRRTLSVPRGKKVAATLVLGYPKVKFLRMAPRKKADVLYL